MYSETIASQDRIQNDRDGNVHWFEVMPLFVSVAADARYQQVLERSR
jgi:hypothetical protein